MILIDEISNQTGSSVQLKLDNNELIIDIYDGFDIPLHSFYFGEKNTIEITKKLQKKLSNEI